jgi:Flp pilus assembly pilin Flp
MRFKSFYKLKKGQSMIEYAVIGMVVVLALMAATGGISAAMRGQVEATSNGLSSGSFLK